MGNSLRKRKTESEEPFLFYPILENMPMRRPIMAGFYNCSSKTCDRLFRTKQNADLHFCWNVQPQPIEKYVRIHYYTSDNPRLTPE